MRFLIIGVLLSFVSCVELDHSPEQVVRDFLSQSSVYNFSIASNSLVEEDAVKYRSLQKFYSELPDSTKATLPKQLNIPEIFSSQTQDSTAIVITKSIDSISMKPVFDTFHLVFQNSFWKIKLQ